MSKNFIDFGLRIADCGSLYRNPKSQIRIPKSKYLNEVVVPGEKIWMIFSRKEVFQPHLPVRLPCYDLAPVTGFTLGRSLRLRTSGTPNFHGLTGGVYKARERIHGSMLTCHY